MLRLRSAGSDNEPLRATHTLFYGLLRRNPAAVLALGGNLELLGCSRAAEDLLTDATLVRVRGDRLVLQELDEQALRDAMKCLTRHSTRALRFSLLRQTSSGKAAVQALIEECSGDGLAECVTGSRLPERVFLLWLHCPLVERHISPQSLREVYALTACEAEVVAHVYDGRSIPETAARLNVSINTVKSHLKNVFQKFDVRSQSQLIKRVALGAWMDWRIRSPRPASSP